MKRDTTKPVIVRSLDDIPDFATEDEERRWWASHELSQELYEQLEDTTPELDRYFPVPKTGKRTKLSRG